MTRSIPAAIFQIRKGASRALLHRPALDADRRSALLGTARRQLFNVLRTGNDRPIASAAAEAAV